MANEVYLMRRSGLKLVVFRRKAKGKERGVESALPRIWVLLTSTTVRNIPDVEDCSDSDYSK